VRRYATLADVRDLGVDPQDNADDTFVDRKLVEAASVVESYVGRPYLFPTAPSTLAFNDVRVPLLPTPGPVSNIQAVTIDGAVVDPAGYQTEPWGLRLYRAGLRDADGWRMAQALIRSSRAPYGSQVLVTATIGWALPPAMLAPPLAPVLAAASAGTLPTGTYAYYLTQVGTSPAGETSPGPEATVAVTGPTGSVTVTFPGMGTYRVYGRSTGAERLLATVTGSAWVDTGAIVPLGTPPPDFPPRVVRANALVAARLVRQKGQPARDPSLIALSLGEYKETYQAAGEMLDTTGDPEADRLLAEDRTVMVG
jgi:hypothetical protein